MTDLVALKGRLAVVTGAGSGIGEAMTLEAGRLGLEVLALDIDPDRLATVAKRAADEGIELHTDITDVAEYAAVEKVAANAVAQFGAPALIINNAGVELAGRIWEMDPQGWNRLQGINVNGVFNVIRAFLPAAIADGRPGHVVMLSSVGGLLVGGNQSGYIVSKHGVRIMAQALAAELAEVSCPIGVTTVCPGPVRTNIFVDAEAAGSTGDGVRAELREMLDKHGVEPSVVADLTFQAVAAGRGWVHPHAEMSRDAIEQTYAELLAGI